MLKIRKKYKFWIILLLSIIVLGFTTQVLPKILRNVKSTEIAQFGEISVRDEVEGFILRKENVYIAGKDINVDYKVYEGTLVKAKSQLVSFSDAKLDEKGERIESPLSKKLGKSAIKLNDGIANEKGTFSTFIDGNEGKMKVENYEKFSMKTLDDLDDKLENVKANTIRKGYPVYKLIDQSEWYIVTWIDNKKLNRYELGQEVTVYFLDEDSKEKSVKFTIKDISDDGKKSKLLLSSTRYHPDFAKLRKVNLSIETLRVSGIIVNNKSIIEKDDKSGVYVVSKTGEEVFKEVKIRGTDGEKSALVENIFYDEKGELVQTIKVFDEVVEKPKRK